MLTPLLLVLLLALLLLAQLLLLMQAQGRQKQVLVQVLAQLLRWLPQMVAAADCHAWQRRPSGL